MKDYSDIINTDYPFPTTHGRQPMSERAKIFLPFAALKGFEEALEEVRKKHIKDSETKTTQLSLQTSMEKL